jgi:hypothetical protein
VTKRGSSFVLPIVPMGKSEPDCVALWLPRWNVQFQIACGSREPRRVLMLTRAFHHFTPFIRLPAHYGHEDPSLCHPPSEGPPLLLSPWRRLSPSAYARGNTLHADAVSSHLCESCDLFDAPFWPQTHLHAQPQSISLYSVRHAGEI